MKQEDLETNFELTLVKELNSAKLSSEEHSADMVDMVDGILMDLEEPEIDTQSIKTKLFKMIDDLQYQDINRQKIERVMNLLIEDANISDEVLECENIAKAPSAHCIDDNDCEVVSDEELEALITQAKN